MRSHLRSFWFGCLVLGSLTALDRSTAQESPSAQNFGETAKPARPKREIPRVSLQTAQDRGRLMHDIYLATLESIHLRYFHGDRAVIPARAMEDVFRDIEYRHHCQARWISASFSAMSLDHEPKTDFEKQAAKKLAAGEELVETIEEGVYRRAGSVPLTGGCLRCHSLDLGNMSTKPRFAGLVISIPVEADAKLDDEP